MLNKNKIIVTGGKGRFGKVLKENVGKNYFFPSKVELNILKLNSIYTYLKKKKTKIFNTFSWLISSYGNP